MINGQYKQMSRKPHELAIDMIHSELNRSAIMADIVSFAHKCERKKNVVVNICSGRLEIGSVCFVVLIDLFVLPCSIDECCISENLPRNFGRFGTMNDDFDLCSHRNRLHV